MFEKLSCLEQFSDAVRDAATKFKDYFRAQQKRSNHPLAYSYLTRVKNKPMDGLILF